MRRSAGANRHGLRWRPSPSSAVLRSIADYGRFGPSLLALVFGLLAWPAVVASVEPAPSGGFGRGEFWTSPAMLLAAIAVAAMVTPLMLGGTTRKSPRTGGIATLAVAWTIAVTTHALLGVIPDAILYGDPQADALSTLVVDVLAGFLLGPYLAIGAFAALSIGVAVWAAVLSPAGARIRAASTVLVFAIPPIYLGMQITADLSNIS